MKKILFSCFIIIILHSCGDKDRQPTVYNLNQQTKDWLFFDTGTYWVYKEHGSGILDSQYVINSYLYYIESDKYDHSSLYEKIQTGHVNISSGFFLQMTSILGRGIIEKISSSGSEGVSTYFFYQPLQIGKKKGTSGLGYTEIIDIDPDYSLDISKRDTLITFLENHDLTENGDSVIYKVMRGVGVVNKKNISKNKEWQLIRYKINLNKQ